MATTKTSRLLKKYSKLKKSEQEIEPWDLDELTTTQNQLDRVEEDFQNL